MNYFVTGTDTGCGKTLVSAILTEALQADYWKPVQAGDEDKDVDMVRSLISNSHSMFLKEAYVLKAPMSPHAAAQREGIEIDTNKINIPGDVTDDLIIEGAGGVLVPLNQNDYVIDLAEKFSAEVILVSRNYLGSINHTMLTINELKRRGLNIKGIIFNGEPNPETESFITSKSGLKSLLHINQEEQITSETIIKYAVELFKQW